MKIVNRFALFVLVLLLGGKILPQDNHKILFLDFKFIKGEPQLVGMQIAKGILKVKRSLPIHSEGVKLTLLSAEDNLLYQNIEADPTESVYEYPSVGGKIGRAVIHKDTVDCTLRVPYTAAIYKIVLNRITPGNNLPTSLARQRQPEYEFRIDHSKILETK